MNKFIKSITKDDSNSVIGCEYEEELFAPVINSLFRNNTFVPNVDHVVYTMKTFDEKAVRDTKGNLVVDQKTGKPKREKKFLDKPTLTTTVYFVDGTKSTVINSTLDPITLDKDGMASESSKEAGVTYALVKRLFGKADERGTIDGTGFGRKLREIVEAGSYSRQPDPREAKIEKEAKISEKKTVKKSQPRSKNGRFSSKAK